MSKNNKIDNLLVQADKISKHLQKIEVRIFKLKRNMKEEKSKALKISAIRKTLK